MQFSVMLSCKYVLPAATEGQRLKMEVVCLQGGGTVASELL